MAYRPVDVLHMMKRVNNQPSPMCPPKARYAVLDAKRWAAHYGMPFAPNRALFQALGKDALDGSLLSRASIAAQELGKFEQFNSALFAAVWAGSDDLLCDEARSAFCAKSELPDDLWRLAETPRIKEKTAKLSEEMADRGVFGVPTIFVDNEMFFGNDRWSFVKDRLQRSTAGVGV